MRVAQRHVANSLLNALLSPDESSLLLLTSGGVAVIVALSAIAVKSQYPLPCDDDSVSMSEMSVVNPVDYTRSNYCGWWDAEHVLVSQLNGDVCVMRAADWTMVSPWERFDVGCLARCANHRAIVISCARNLMVDCDGKDHLTRVYSAVTLEGVTPKEKFLNCIENRMMSQAAALATQYHFDTDLMYTIGCW